MMKIKINVAIGILVIFAALIIAGCAGKSTELLAEDYKKMSNEQILEYF